jgi:hypothetical protein
MNHRFDKRDHHVYLTVITDDNFTVFYMIRYNTDFDYHYVYLNSNQLEIMKYLVLNNIGTIFVDKHSQKLILTPNALLELI